MFVIQIDAGLFFLYVQDKANATQIRENAKRFPERVDAEVFREEYIPDDLPCKIEEA